ncbi:MAG: rhodanese-like domain-containing protein [Thermodesulfobacteriota bacterium]
MKAVRILCCLTFTLLLSVACSNSQTPDNKTADTQAVQNQAPFVSLQPAAANELIAARKDLLIVDVRTPQELKEGKIANSIMIPFWSAMRGQHNLSKNQPILLVCAVGGRSFAVGQALTRQQGFTEVYNLSGGISSWKGAGLPVVY